MGDERGGAIAANGHLLKAAAQDKANQHHMPWGWTYSLALEFLTLASLFINFSHTNPRVLLSQTTAELASDV
ncbi:unnamed protein product [Pleuronectes platessa]|uniref:Uncharacterized protein n=1 Tax=Pleuronectes platessa TaxID=8262 RepID=A0A9N7Z770_PLEPL|nr:unnamed protein product [Pleuronectes platessa]